MIQCNILWLAHLLASELQRGEILDGKRPAVVNLQQNRGTASKEQGSFLVATETRLPYYIRQEYWHWHHIMANVQEKRNHQRG